MTQKHGTAQVQHLSHSFRTDANLLIEKVERANQPKATRTAYIAKLVIDTYMACECALKSMIASANCEKSGNQVYVDIIKSRHNFNCLIQQARPESLNDDWKTFLKHASEYGVNLRYSLDLFSVATCDWLPDDNVDFIMDQKYLEIFLIIAKALAKEADARHKKIFNNTTIILSMNEVKTFVEELRAVSKKQKNMC